MSAPIEVTAGTADQPSRRSTAGTRIVAMNATLDAAWIRFCVGSASAPAPAASRRRSNAGSFAIRRRVMARHEPAKTSQ